MTTAIEALQAVEDWWLTQADQSKGAPACIFLVREVLAEHRRMQICAPPHRQQRHTRTELLAMFGADYTSDESVGQKAGCCAACFDYRECVGNMQCRLNLSTLTRIAPAT